MNGAKRLAAMAVLTAAALAAGFAESQFPLPFPGMRLGLANVFYLTALIVMGGAEAVTVAAARLALSFLLTGNAAALVCGASGSALSLSVTIALFKFFPDSLSVPAISVAGAFAFNFGQIAAVALIVQTCTVFAYLPPLLLCASVTGFAVGRLAVEMGKRLAVVRAGR
ncbi:MAG: Gx transporter family protein [Synergistaceae bacterium]|jgi:heptaprenyl diphosphate synthase|nr:Gx transporter family protein [Synergistaceae bacterium]